MTDTKEPIAINSPKVHETAISLIKGEKVTDVLDLGAGQGALTKKLMAMGYKVTAADLHIENFKLEKIKCVKVDLNEPIKIKDNSYDCVFCLDVIEHLKNPWHLMEEVHRITRKGGIAVLSTPNNENWYSRIWFLLLAKFPHFRKVYYNKDGSIFWDSHITPIFLYMFKEMIRGKFEIVKITSNRAMVPLIRLPLPFRGPFFGENLIIKLRRIG